LGLRTPCKPSKVENLKKYKYDKSTGRIVQWHMRKLLVMGGNPLWVLIETLVAGKFGEDPLSMASIGTALTTAMEQNLKNLFCQN